jgi:hypothetical protein
MVPRRRSPRDIILETFNNTTRQERRKVAHFVSSKLAFDAMALHEASLHELIKHSYNFQSSDPRNLIYAFIGLAPRYNILPDYGETNSMSQVLKLIVRRVIKQDRSLAIVVDAVIRDRDDRRLRLPSWVADFTKGYRFHDNEMGKLIRGYRGRRYQASGYEEAVTKFVNLSNMPTGLILKCRGVRLSRLVGIPAFVGRQSDPYRQLLRFRTEMELWADVTVGALPNDELWILYGAPIVFVLRRSDLDGAIVLYTIIGAALLYRLNDDIPSDIMFGSILDQVRNGTTYAEDIHIE